MKRPNRLLRLAAVLAILSGMLIFAAPAAVASPSPGGEEALWDGQTIPPLFGATESDVADQAILCFTEDYYGNVLTVDGGPFCDGAQEVYFAAVGNGDDFGLGAAQTSVTIQNIDSVDAYVFFYVGNGNGWDVTQYAYLTAGASKTFTASDLGIADGDVVPVVAAAYHVLFAVSDCTYDDASDTWDCGDYGSYPGDWYDPDVAILADPAFIAGVAKQAVSGDLLPMTTEADTSVSGYNAVSGREVGFFDQLYFPIVQTNCGPGGCWDSILRIANVGLDQNAAVTVRFFPADDGSGSLQTGFQLQALVDVGQTWSIDLADWVPAGWVGSAHVFSDDAVTAIVDRYKAGTNMWITNTASNAAAENYWQYPTGPSGLPYVLFAPDVRLDYNGWNTGINVANTVDDSNEINIQYFGNNGNAPQTLSQRLDAQGMTYFYEPSDPSEDDCQQPANQAPTCDFVGGAIILSEYPVAVAVDGTKYYGNDANVGHAFSYAATGNVYTDQALPLAQKGNPASGMGATSGINFLNPNADSTYVQTWWINPSGFQADNFGPVIVWVPGFATGFVYTMFQHNLPNGFTGAALVTSDLPIAATSANVDYQVQGDGTVIYDLYNPCGFFRQSGYPGDDPSCVYEAPVTPPVVNNPGLIVKTVSCPDCSDSDTTVVGATVNVSGTTDDGDDYFRSADTNANGEAIFSVPAGVYTVEITDVPSGYAIDPATSTDSDVSVAEGETVNLDNTVLEAGATKVIDTAVPGALVCVFERGVDQGGKPLPIENPECERGVTELPKDFVPGQGETYAKLRDPDFSYIDPEIEPYELECSDFEYVEDAQAYEDWYFDNHLGSKEQLPGLDPNEDGIVDCDELPSIPYVRPETDEEIAERLGAVAVKETDENGDASFDLPAGCYYAVINAPGYDLAVEEFCLSAGETEVNEVDLGEAPGYLQKFFIPPFCQIDGSVAPRQDIEDLFDQIDCDYTGEGGYPEYLLDWTDVAMTVAVLDGSCADAVESTFNSYDTDGLDYENLLGDCTGVSFFGGADDLLIGGIPGLPYLYLALAPGDYTVCWYAEWTYNPFSDYYDYIDAGVICDEFTITSGETTDLINYSDDLLRGSLDVFVETDGGAPLSDILVLLFDQDGNLIDYDCSGDFGNFPGWAHFYYLPEGNYTVTATDSASGFDGIYPCGDGDTYETQSALISYNVFEDYPVISDWVWAPVGDPDVIIDLDPE